MKLKKRSVNKLVVFCCLLVISSTVYAIYCSECGSRNSDDAKYCSKCGTKLEEGPRGTRELKPGKVKTNSIDMKLAYVPAGLFIMGGVRSDSAYAARTGLKDEHPHPVKLSKGFYMGVYEVTQAQWKSVMGTSVSKMRDKVGKSYQLAEVGSDYPMYYVNWEDCTEFCRKLSQMEGKTYRLPTEAEWEYACRAGTTTEYSFGDDKDDFYKYGNYADSSIKVRHSDTKHNDGYTWLAPVGSYKPNVFGLYDMHGNVIEWCSDWYDKDYYEECMFGKADGTYIATKDAMIIKDPVGPKSGTQRIVRGGFYSMHRGQCRSAFRNGVPPKNTNTTTGFRVVLETE